MPIEISIVDEDRNIKKNGNKQKIAHAYIDSHGLLGKILYQLRILFTDPTTVLI